MTAIRKLIEACAYENVDRLDSDENIFFARELEHILVELTETKYAKRTHRQFFPIDTSAGPTADTITWRQITRLGQAKIIADYADEIPKVNVNTEEKSQRVRSQAIAAQWSLQEIRASASVGRSLDREDAIAAREAMMRLEGDIAFNGDTTHDLIGLFSAGTGIPFASVSGGIWTTKTPIEVKFDMDRATNEVPENTGDNEEPDTLALPTFHYNYVHETNMGNGTDTTIAQYFLKNNPYIKRLTKHRELSGKGPGGEDVMIAYEFNTRKLQLNIPLDVESLPPERKGLMTEVTYHQRHGGVTIRRPISINMKYGI